MRSDSKCTSCILNRARYTPMVAAGVQPGTPANVKPGALFLERCKMLHRSHCSASCRVVPLPSRCPHARGRGLQVRNTTKRLCTSPVWARPEVPCLCSLHLQPVCTAHAPGAPGNRITGSCLSLQCRSDLRLDVQVNAIAQVSPTAQAHTLSVLQLPSSSQPSARNMLNSLRAST